MSNTSVVAPAAGVAIVAGLALAAGLAAWWARGKVTPVATLPPAVQQERSVLLIRMEAAEHISVAERNAVYAAWLASYPDEMELPLKLTVPFCAVPTADIVRLSPSGSLSLLSTLYTNT